MQQGYFRSCLVRIQVLEAALLQAGVPIPPNTTTHRDQDLPGQKLAIGNRELPLGSGALDGQQMSEGRRLVAEEVDISAEVGVVCHGASSGRWLPERRESSDRSSDASDNDGETDVDVPNSSCRYIPAANGMDLGADVYFEGGAGGGGRVPGGSYGILSTLAPDPSPIRADFYDRQVELVCTGRIIIS